MQTFETKDSGQREDFGTGSVRDVETDKLDWTLLPFTALERFIGLMMRGAAKYGRHNWTKGQSMQRAERSLLRHVVAYMNGDREEDHMAAVVFNACVILDHEERIARGELTPHLDDRDLWRQTTPLTLGPDEPDCADGCRSPRPDLYCCGAQRPARL